MSRKSSGHSSAFTLIEVLASVIILSLGLLSACALAAYGLRLVSDANGRTIGMSTALTVLADPSPLRTDPSQTPDGAVSEGYLNGMWVERREADEVVLDGAAGRLQAVTVSVDVFDAKSGRCHASITRRMLRRLP